MNGYSEINIILLSSSGVKHHAKAIFQLSVVTPQRPK